MKIIRLVKGQHDSLLAPISYNFYTITFPLIPSDGDKIRPTCNVQSCVGITKYINWYAIHRNQYEAGAFGDDK